MQLSVAEPRWRCHETQQNQEPQRNYRDAKKPAGGIEGILSAFGARAGTNRAKLLARLARGIGRPVRSETVYGKADAPSELAMWRRRATKSALPSADKGPAPQMAAYM